MPPRYAPLAALLVLAASLTAAAQETGSLEDAELTRVRFLDPDRGWAIGDRGAIWHTSDGGARWSLQRTSTTARLEALSVLDERHLWAAGGDIRPFTHRSQGVLLRSHDGGLHWNSATETPNGDSTGEQPLPWIRELRMFDDRNGLAAGDPSRLLGGGLYATSDGGRTWKPQPGVPARRWAAAEFINPFVGLLTEPNGPPLLWRQRTVEAGRMPREERRIRRIIVAGASGGWAIGERGLVLHTEDAGRSWNAPAALLPGVASEHDFRAIAAHGDSVWIAGSPGGLVFHSPDAGRSWQVQLTENALPLNDLHFLDANRGWAVGALGTILATRDGGATWRKQRGAAPRAAVLLLATDPEHLDFELAARLTGDDRALVAAAVLFDAHTASSAEESDVRDRARRAASVAGVSSMETSHRFPVPRAELMLPEQAITSAWGNSPEAGADSLRAHLVRQLRTWRPDVVIVSGPAAESQERALTHRLLAEAVGRAADEGLPATRVAGLHPWKVSKVFTRSEPGDWVVVASQWSPGWGESLGDRAALARSFLTNELAAEEATKSYRLLYSRFASARAGRDFLADLGSSYEDIPRRAGTGAPSGNLDALRRMAQRRQMVDAIVRRGVAGDGSGAAWLAQLDDLLAGLNPAGAGMLLLDTANRLRREDRREPAEEVYQAILQRYPREPVAEAAAFELLRHAVSRELQTGRRSTGLVRLLPAQPEPAQGGVAFAFGAEESPIEGGQVQQAAGLAVDTGRGGERTARLVERFERAYPGLMSLPEARCLTAASQRGAQGFNRGAKARQIYEALAAGDAADPWTRSAQGELWLLRPGPVGPKPFVVVGESKERPFLDGGLDDALWREAARLELRSPARDDRDWPAAVYFARDEEYLYVAGECRLPPGAAPWHEAAERRRDEDLSNSERIVLSFDVDRDYATAFHLTVDRHGATIDRAGDRLGWNPGWYVSTGGDGAHWRFEAAIPLRELHGEEAPLEAWGLAVARIVPGFGLQTWENGPGVAESPAEYGYLRFK